MHSATIQLLGSLWCGYSRSIYKETFSPNIILLTFPHLTSIVSFFLCCWIFRLLLFGAIVNLACESHLNTHLSHCHHLRTHVQAPGAWSLASLQSYSSLLVQHLHKPESWEQHFCRERKRQKCPLCGGEPTPGAWGACVKEVQENGGRNGRSDSRDCVPGTVLITTYDYKFGSSNTPVR